MIMSSMIIFGAVSLQRLGISYMPDVDFPVLDVSVTWEGAAPQFMEAEIVDRLERRIISVEGLKQMTSTVRQGSADISLEFDIDRNIDTALQEVQATISRIQLPGGVDPPVIRKSNPEQSPILWVALSGERSQTELFRLADQIAIDRIQLVEGVGEVFMGGSAERNLRIWINRNKLKEYELTVIDVRAAIQRDHVEGASGYLENDEKERTVRALGEANTIEDIENIRITTRGGRPVFFSDIQISDVATVEDGLSDRRRVTRMKGTEAVSIGIRKQIGANTVATGQAVKAEIERIEKFLPDDVQMDVMFDSTIFVEEAIEETQFTLILSGILTALVCWLFLGNLSSTFNVVLSIPTSIIGTFLIMYFMGFTMNLFTLLALSLAIGIVVDDNIMVLENIIRHHDMGKDKVTAAREGTSEIAFAALATSIAVIAIFLPIAFMEGIIGKFFFEFAITLTAAVALSLVDALTLTPMRASVFIAERQKELRIIKAVRLLTEKITEIYAATLSVTLKRPFVVLAGTLGFFSLSMIILFFIEREFVPSQDQSRFGLMMQAPTGSSLNHTLEKVKEVEQVLDNRNDVEKYLSITGGFRGGESNTARMFLTLTDPSERKSQQEIMQEVRESTKKIEGLRTVVLDFSSRGLTAGRTYPVDFSIRGGEWTELKETAEKIMKRLEQEKLTADLDMDYREGMPETRIIPLRKEAADRGVSMQSIMETTAIGIGGIREGRFTSDGRRYDVRIRLKPDQWSEPSDISKLNVRNIHGELIPLSDVAEVKTVPTVQQLTRIDRQRAIQIYGNVAEGKSQSGVLERAEQIALEEMPEGYSFFTGGGSRGLQETFDNLSLALWLGVLVAYMVLAAQFNSFIHPVSIMLALPFSITGAITALYITGQSLNLYSMIGIILLMGIAKKNSIMLVEFTNTLRNRDGYSITDALVSAGQTRFRPVLMTSLSAIAAALPPALAIGPGAESRIPMAIAVIGGMVVSTALTLYAVPAAYLVLSKFEIRQRSF